MTRLVWTAEKRKLLSGHGPGTKKHKSHHHSSTFQGRAIAMEVDGGGHDAKRQKHEARMIPGLGALEWGFPNSIITQLRYCDLVALTSTSGGTVSQIYRANGTFDPDYTGSGHQPMWRDNYANIYDFYTVLGSKITVTFHSRNATFGAVVGIIGSDSSSISSTITTLMEENNSVHTLLGSANTQPETLSLTFSPLEHLGSNVKDENASMTAVGADPSAGEGTFYFGLYAATEDLGTTVTVTAKVEIEYTVKFTYLSKQAQN